MKTLYSFAITLALFAATESIGFAAEPATKPVATQTSDDEDEVVTCEKENVTGSRVKKRTVCATRKQRRDQREQTENDLDGFRAQGTTQRDNGG